jgi:lipopolysaccharide/colanic/teichoic acid biosynthesis glycosyltransferase
VKPGVTGWAQINYPYGDSIEDAKEKLKYELYYMKHRSLWLDLAIIFQTIKVALKARGSQ